MAAPPGLLRAFLLLLLALALPCHAATGSRERAEDFDAMRRAIDASYAYPESMAAWNARVAALRTAAAKARDADRFVATLERALDLLHDDHATLSIRSHGAARWVPAESDVWARFVDGKARIEAVRVASDADVAGLQPGQEVTRIQGVEVARAVDQRLGNAGAPPAQRDWALRHLLAGPRRGRFVVTLADGRDVNVEHHAATRLPAAGIARRMGEARDLAYIRPQFLGGPPLARQLDEGLAAVGTVRALILDLRGNADIEREQARAVLVRLARAPGAWQVRLGRDGVRHEDRIDAVQPGSRVPLVVLVDRWTGGEAEGLALGLRTLAQATLIGTPMAQLRGATTTLRLPHSGIGVRFPAERALAADGTPREDARPDVLVDLAAASGGPGDPILYQALKKLEASAKPLTPSDPRPSSAPARRND